MHPGEVEEFDSTFGDQVSVRISADPYEDHVFVGVYDSDEHRHATVALDPQTSHRLGMKLVGAAFANLEQQQA